MCWNAQTLYRKDRRPNRYSDMPFQQRRWLIFIVPWRSVAIRRDPETTHTYMRHRHVSPIITQPYPQIPSWQYP